MDRAIGVSLAVSVAAFAGYTASLCPTIFVGDSGELAMAAATLGLAHPPGYPLWTILGRVAVVALPGEPAFALNTFSALASSAACGLLAYLLMLLTGRLAVSAGVAAAFAFSHHVWSQSVITEVYSLNLLITVSALLAAFAGRRGRPKLFHLAAYLLGLGSANHPFILLAGLPVFSLVLLPGNARGESVGKRAGHLLPMAGLFLLGVSAYLYLPIRWSQDPEMNWGAIRNTAEILDHILRVQYGGLGEAAADSPALVRLRVFAEVLATGVPVLLLTAAAWGAYHLWRKDRTTALVLLGFFFVAGPMTASIIRFQDTFLDRSTISVYFISAALACFLLAGIGLAALDEIVRAKLTNLPRMGFLFTAAVAVLTPALVHQANKKRCDRSDSTLARLYATTVLQELPRNARIYAIGDNACFSLLYFHEVMGLRPDVVLSDRTLNLLVHTYGEDFLPLSRVERKARHVERERELAFDHPERAVFYTELIDLAPFDGCRLIDVGLAHQLVRPGESVHEVEHEPIVLPSVAKDEFLESLLAAVTLYREGSYFLRVQRHDDARSSYEKSAHWAQEIPAVLRNLGLGRLDLGDYAEAEELFLAALELEPDNQDALYNLAILYSHTERVQQSLSYFERLEALGAAYAEVYLNYGVELLKAGRLQEAESRAAKALELEPDFQPAADLAAAIQLGMSIGGEAGVLEALRKIEPITVGGTLQLAQRYLERGDFQKATELYREAALGAPESPEAAYGLGFGMLRAGHFEEAGKAFRRLLEIRPENADSRNALAYVFAQTGDSLATAQALAEEALKLDPSRAAYWNDTLGWVLFRRGHHERALETLLAAEKLMPPDDLPSMAENDYHVGVVLMELGRTEEARTYLQRSASRAKDEFWLLDLQARSRKLGIEGATL
jgi:tetratricopeptide (TPR) repeat protein